MIKAVRFALAVLLMGVLVSLNSLAQKPSEGGEKIEDGKKYVAEQVVASVGNQSIMLSEWEGTTKLIETDRQANGARSQQSAKDEAFETLLLQKLMVTQALQDSLDKDIHSDEMSKEVDAIVDQMAREAGSYLILEQNYGKPLYDIKRDIQKQRLHQQLMSQMQMKVTQNVTITYPEVLKFISSFDTKELPRFPARYSYAQIVKIPPTTDEKKFAIRERLLEFREKILAGEQFSTLARLYSDDAGSARAGGMIEAQDINSFVAPFADAVRLLKPGQISEMVETEYGFHIIELIERKGDIVTIRHILLKPKFSYEETNKMMVLLDSIAGEINAGKITFKDAAYQFSDDNNTKMNSGLVFNDDEYKQTGDIHRVSTYFFADDLTNPKDQVIITLQIGEISAPYESVDKKGNTVCKIVKLEDKIPAHTASLEQDYEVIEQFSLNNKQNQVLDKWIKKAIANTFIYISPEYIDEVEFERPEWKMYAKTQLR